MKKTIFYLGGLAVVILLFIFVYSALWPQTTSTRAEEKNFIMQAGNNGTSCTQNSDCASGYCFNTCLPSYPLATELNIDSYSSSDSNSMCSGWMRGNNYGNTADAKADFDSYGGGTAGWNKWSGGQVCSVDVWYTYAAPNYIYKAYTTSGISFRIAEDEGGSWGCSDDFIKKVMGYVLCGQGGTPTGPVCGDGTCASTEDCSSCPSDCGQCTITLKKDGEKCTSNSECSGGYCVHEICRGYPFYWGDGYCDTEAGETCLDSSDPDFCSPDCAEIKLKEKGESCSSNSQCSSDSCSHGICCQSGLTCCQKDADCASGAYCNTSQKVCYNKINDGESCSEWRQCKGGHCVHSICRSADYYCGDKSCDSQYENCSNCAADCGACPAENKSVNQPAPEEKPEEKPQQVNEPVEETKSPDLKISFSAKKIDLLPDGSAKLKINFKNAGEGLAKNVSLTIWMDKAEVAEISPKEKTIGDIKASGETNAEINVKAKSNGTAHLAFRINGDNFGSKMSFVQVNVEPALALDVPESIFLQPQETQEVGVFLINQSSKLAKVLSLTMESSDSSVVTVEAGATMEVRGQGSGIKTDQLFSTESEDILKAIAPRPKITAQKEGEANLVFKLSYNFPENKQSITEKLEKTVKVKVGKPLGGKKNALDFQIIPAGIALEPGEARQVKLVLKNQGSEIIRQGKINITKSSGSLFDATSEVKFGFIEPGQQATAYIDVVANENLSATFQELAKKGDLAVNGTLAFDGQYQTLNKTNFTFKDTLKVSLVEEREACDSQNQACVQAVSCLMELSNSMSCALEVADVIPYLDKPVAAVLATSDACDIKNRATSGDSIGAAVTSVLMASDLADNAADAVPGAGNMISTFADIVEGAADCSEGFIHDAVDQYCAGGTGKGYTGCAEKLFALFAQASGPYKEPTSARKYVVAVIGSPVTFSIVDNSGETLTPADGVLVLQEQELKLAFIKNPDQLKNGYNFQVNGYENGQYNISLALIDNGQIIDKKELKDQSISIDQTVTVPLAVRATNLLLGEEAENAQKEEGGNDWILYAIIIGLAAIVVFIGWGIWKLIQKKLKKSKVEDLKQKVEDAARRKGAKKWPVKKIITIIIVIIIVVVAGWLAYKYNLFGSSKVSKEGSCESIDLAKDVSNYYYTKSGNACDNYQDNLSSSQISTKCKTAAGQFRKHFVKEIDVAGTIKVGIKANLGLNEYQKFFSECNGVGVKYDKYVRLAILSADPRPELNVQCNKTATTDDEWNNCSVNYNDSSVIGSCYVLECATARQCDFEINVAGQKKIYAVFVVADAWADADVEGTLANLQVCEE